MYWRFNLYWIEHISLLREHICTGDLICTGPSLCFASAAFPACSPASLSFASSCPLLLFGSEPPCEMSPFLTRPTSPRWACPWPCALLRGQVALPLGCLLALVAVPAALVLPPVSAAICARAHPCALPGLCHGLPSLARSLLPAATASPLLRRPFVLSCQR